MRRISLSDLSIQISFASENSDNGLTVVSIDLPIDANQYFIGNNLIDCLVPNLLPDLPSLTRALTQELTPTELEQLALELIGVPQHALQINSNQTTIDIETKARALEVLTKLDNAALGGVDIVNGKVEYS